MTAIDKETWDKLSRPLGDKLVARLALPEITNRLFCALDSQGIRHLLIFLHPEDDTYQDAQSRGIRVATRELTIQGQSAEKYLDIECLDEVGFSIFDLMGGEIAEELENAKKPPIDGVKQILAKWRRFWGQQPHQILSREEQIGLFAELWFLSVWLIPKIGPNVVMAWRGPWGSRHDFEWTDKSVEVKATAQSRGRVYKIHGLGQLENPAQGPLYLFGVRLREEMSAGNNLPGLVENCRKQLNDVDDAFMHFETALVQIGYSPIHQDEYAKLNLHVLEDVLFVVDEDFPRITDSTFPSGLPSGVEQVEYEINLDSFNHLITASSPEQLPFSQTP